MIQNSILWHLTCQRENKESQIKSNHTGAGPPISLILWNLRTGNEFRSSTAALPDGRGNGHTPK